MGPKPTRPVPPRCSFPCWRAQRPRRWRTPGLRTAAPTSDLQSCGPSPHRDGLAQRLGRDKPSDTSASRAAPQPLLATRSNHELGARRRATASLGRAKSHEHFSDSAAVVTSSTGRIPGCCATSTAIVQDHDAASLRTFPHLQRCARTRVPCLDPPGRCSPRSAARRRTSPVKNCRCRRASHRSHQQR